MMNWKVSSHSLIEVLSQQLNGGTENNCEKRQVG
jgi:hypothetical protein